VRRLSLILVGVLAISSACSPRPSPPAQNSARILALTSTTFLADITRNVAGQRVQVESLLPAGVDPHAFQPTPADIARITESEILIINGVEYEHFLGSLLENAEGQRIVVEASAGLQIRESPQREHGLDPHLWLDPNNVIVYTENIRDALIQTDPEGKQVYQSDAAAYIEKLKELDAWIVEQVSSLPAGRRLLVTNHDALGYFADRYDFRIVGTVLPSVSSEASVSAKELSQVIDAIRANDVPAIFLDEVENQNLVTQIAQETGVTIVDDLHVESLTDGPPAATYIDMMMHNVSRIVEALK